MAVASGLLPGAVPPVLREQVSVPDKMYQVLSKTRVPCPVFSARIDWCLYCRHCLTAQKVNGWAKCETWEQH